MWSRSSYPLLDLQTWHLGEILPVARHQCRTIGQGEGRDQEVAPADLLRFLILSQSVELRGWCKGSTRSRPPPSATATISDQPPRRPRPVPGRPGPVMRRWRVLVVSLLGYRVMLLPGAARDGRRGRGRRALRGR